ncbi:polyketide synthase dehydratase domain-containing protein [Streptomyces tricolor]|nr:polyketide synthase dehydratase domain-containing protein [Streptomyces tricolor]
MFVQGLRRRLDRRAARGRRWCTGGSADVRVRSPALLAEARPRGGRDRPRQVGADHPPSARWSKCRRPAGCCAPPDSPCAPTPWLADHAVGGAVLVPGTGLVELAVRAGDEVGCGVLEELVIEAPLVLPEQGGVRLQVAVGGPAETGSPHGRRVLGTRGRRRRRRRRRLDPARHRHPHRPGTGRRGPAGRRPRRVAAHRRPARWTSPAATNCWPRPATATGRSSRAYAPLWRRGDDLFAEVALPEDQRAGAGRFGIHPALLDAALHPAMLDVALSDPEGENRTDDGNGVHLPFGWNGLRLHASGASALRVRLTRSAPDALSLDAADETGTPVLTLRSLWSPGPCPPISSARRPTTAGSPCSASNGRSCPRPRSRARTCRPPGCRSASRAHVAALTDGSGVPPVVVLEAGRTGGDGRRGGAFPHRLGAGGRPGVAGRPRPRRGPTGRRHPGRRARRRRADGDRPGRRGRVGPGPGRPGGEPRPDRPAGHGCHRLRCRIAARRRAGHR